LELFYRESVPEAAVGKIKIANNVNYAIVFNTKLLELKKVYRKEINEELMVPTLIIDNKRKFDKLLCEYVIKALKYYDDRNFFNKKERIKEILAHLLANATYDDFNKPINFLKKRIAFLDNANNYSENIGYSDILGCDLNLEIRKDTINNETPEEFVIECRNKDEKYLFPRVKFGIMDDTVYIYAIQNSREEKNNLTKQINRKLYKVGEGFTDSNNEENYKDVTASFLVVLNMAINYFNSIGYNKFIIPSILIVRWNAKQIMNNNMNEIIQYNITNKLIRTCLRLGVHDNNIDVMSLPYEVDSNLHLHINNMIDMKCNNKLLEETGNMVRINNDVKKR
jgi:hypothetical protein